MMDLCSFMYLRPGNVWQDFIVKRKVVKNDNGYPIESTEEAGTLTGILGEASANDADRTRYRWNQDQHSLTHTLVIREKAEVYKGDWLVLGDRVFLVLLYEDIGSLGINGLIYLEERNDVK